MSSGKREHSDIPLPSTLVYATAMTCGVLAAIAVQIQLGRGGYDLLSLGQNLSSLRELQLRAAGPWWGMLGVAFLVGGATAGTLSRFPLPWRRYRLLRWVSGAAVVLLLAHIGHGAAALAPKGTGANLAVSLGGIAIAAVMALGGAYLTARR